MTTPQLGLETPTEQPPARRASSATTTSVPALLARIVLLGTMAGAAAALTPALVAGDRWVFLVVVWAVVAVVLGTYATRRAVPLKYLAPGTLLLVLFIVLPVLTTLQLSTTNYGDGTRGTQEQTVAALLGNSVVRTPDSPEYGLTVGTTGPPNTGPFTFFLVPRSGDAVYAGTQEGLEELGPDDVTVVDGYVTEAPGYTLLTPTQVNDASAALGELTVPTESGAIVQRGVRAAYEGATTLRYDEATETITDTETGVQYSPQVVGDRELFVAADGTRLSNLSWRADVGLANYERAFTDPVILQDFLRIFAWTLAFATASVALTFGVGTALALMLDDSRVRGQRIYRSVLLLPYAIPGFITILVWSGFFNRDFGLVNDLTGLDVNWLGDPWTARFAVLLVNTWLGFPYMFLVVTGALQAIPGELKEAADIDGAGGLVGFARITFPLLLVGVAPLLVATFAFNFNNYNVIALLTGGGPFTPDNPTAGGTDILISYTVRLAFGAGGAQIGFASAIATLLFVITGVMAALQFRATRRLEEVS